MNEFISQSLYIYIYIYIYIDWKINSFIKKIHIYLFIYISIGNILRLHVAQGQMNGVPMRLELPNAGLPVKLVIFTQQN